MNKTVVTFARGQIKNGLTQLEDKHRLFFKRLYSHDNLEKPIEDIVADMPEERLSQALNQVENSLKKKAEGGE